jgi:hypothetical protein
MGPGKIMPNYQKGKNHNLPEMGQIQIVVKGEIIEIKCKIQIGAGQPR